MYTPDPIDTKDVALDPEIRALGEMLSENTHEVWAKKRMDEGWTWGTERDDEKKTHPCLVPYDQLPERERDYDRATSMETLSRTGVEPNCPATMHFRIFRRALARKMVITEES